MPSSTSFSYDDLIAALSAWLEETSEEFIDNQSIIVSLGETRLTTDLNFEIFDRVIIGDLTTDQYVQAIKPSDWQGTRSLHLRDPAVSADADFADVVLLLSLDGVDGATVAVDDSLFNNSVNFQGAIALDTTIKKFGTAALDADTDDPLDFLEIPHNTVFPVLAGDWTIEFQVNTFDQVGGHDYINHGDGGTGTTNWSVLGANGTLFFNYATGGGGLNNFLGFGTMGPNSTFQHIAITRLGNDLFAHIDGVKSGATFDVTGVTIGGTGAIPINIGSRNESGATPNIADANASIDEVRITVGTARYTTANFTPPTQAFPSGSSAGLRRYLERRTYEWCLDFEPDETATAEPKYYAEFTETEFFMVPPPDLEYGFELRQIQTPDALAPGNQNTWLGDNAGDLLLYACLLASDEFLISDAADLDTWRQSYAELMPARKMELRRQWRGDYDPVKSAAETVSISG
jgi:hypothetical protein